MKVVFVIFAFLFGSSFAAWNFKPLSSQSNCLTVPGNNDATGATFTVATCSASNTYQQLTDAIAGNPLVLLAPFTSPTCNPTVLAVNTSAGTGNGVRVVANAYDPGSKNQYWARLTPTSGALPGYLWYQNLATGRCMTMEGGGSYVDQWDCSNGQTHQMWLLSAGDQTIVVGGNSVLKNQLLLGTQCLNVKNSNPNPGASLYAQLCNTASFAQNFQTLSSQPVTWQVSGSGKCVDGNTQVPAPFQYPCTPTAPNHQWVEFYYLSETIGTHFMNIATGLCLTWNPNNVNDVHTEPCVKGNTNQQWVRTAA